MAKKNEQDEMLNAISAFLKLKGWSVAVIGGARIQKQPADAEFKYEFVVGFVGGPPKDAKPPGEELP
jgi:hypothetical protein